MAFQGYNLGRVGGGGGGADVAEEGSIKSHFGRDL